MPSSLLTAADKKLLAKRGIAVEEAQRQIGILRGPPAYRQLLRPCRVGDGIVSIPEDEHESLIQEHEAAARQGRFVKMVPASGAATRMFRDLLAVRARGPKLTRAEVEDEARAGSQDARGVLAFVDAIPRLALGQTLREALARRGRNPLRPEPGHALEALLGAGGLDADRQPKGLLPFHLYAEGSRTAFEEHLVEAAAFVADAGGVCRVHFTVSPEHRERFEAGYAARKGALERRLLVRFEVSFSVQKPSTDTVALGGDGRPFRGPDGELVFRPAGHGALIENLGELDADVVFVKNIDNIVPEPRQAAVVRWKKILGGHLVAVQREMHLHAARLRATSPEPWVVDEAGEFLSRRLGTAVPPGMHSTEAAVEFLRECVERPLRVCGVVRNVGEPGGGPFWVRGADGLPSRQIVEGAEVDPGSEAQQAILRSATHFNPVDLVCGLRDAAGTPFPLREFVEPAAVIVGRKSSLGRDVVVLERPGLWNGAMSRWNTVFVEVPLETFAPVKTIHDLLRPEHVSGDVRV